MVATEAQNALQYAPRHLEGSPLFNGQCSYEQGEYAQQRYFMPPAALPMRLAVNTDSNNGKGERHPRCERKRNGTKSVQREQQAPSLPSETGPGVISNGGVLIS